ncbi:MAG TPA: ATP-binding protein [Candidatus Binatia bacterium]|nr:ATP-binding protein [Candidatus Binatia bacterium]
MPATRHRIDPEARRGRLRPADPFELIRWLARSQTDPRKALAELVQNSLDAGAATITVLRQRDRGVAAIHVLDDGGGIIPEMERPEALAHVATHIGHSRKRNLTPEQRRELLLQGQYGIGLLGFWSIGQELEVRSQVAGGRPWTLRMWEERPNFEVAPMRGRLRVHGGTWTEVLVRELHRPALVSLTGRRVADYLAAELRGQLLGRAVALTVHDRIGRGLAQKVRRVEPVRFPGVRLDVPEEVPVPGRSPIRAELYVTPEGDDEPGRVSVACGGTVVYPSRRGCRHGRGGRARRLRSRGGGRHDGRGADAPAARTARPRERRAGAQPSRAPRRAALARSPDGRGGCPGAGRVVRLDGRRGGRRGRPGGRVRRRLPRGRRDGTRASRRDVAHSYPVPQGGALLERLVAVLTLTERRLEKGS